MNLNNIKMNLDTALVPNVGYHMSKVNAPRAFNCMFNALDMNAIMLPIEIEPGSLEAYLDACRLLKIRHMVVTMPHKANIIPLLDHVDSMSAKLHSVNSVKFLDDGSTTGIGLDGWGAVNALLSHNVKLRGINAMMLGAGGISGVIAAELYKQGVKKLTILNNPFSFAENMCAILKEHTGLEVEALPSIPENLDKAAENAELFVHCTPLGMAGFPHTHEYLGFIDRLPAHAAVLDAIINPPKTPVVERALARGLQTVPGVKMLVEQVVGMFDFLFGVKLTPSNKQACLDELSSFLKIDPSLL